MSGLSDKLWRPDFSAWFRYIAQKHKTEQNIWRKCRKKYSLVLQWTHSECWYCTVVPPSTLPSLPSLPLPHRLPCQSGALSHLRHPPFSPTMTSLVTSEILWAPADPGNEVTTLECEREDDNYTPPSSPSLTPSPPYKPSLAAQGGPSSPSCPLFLHDWRLY